MNDAKQAGEILHILPLVIEQTCDSITITDKKGVIVYCNVAACRIRGRVQEEIIGKTAYFARPDVRGKGLFRALWENLEKGESWRGPLMERRQDRSTYPTLASISPICDEAGEIAHYVCIQRDMTDQHILEEQLHQSQKMEALGTLVGGIAHDFNNMLAGMTGNLYLARRKVEDKPDVVEKLRNVEKLSFRAADMINQLLTFARKDIRQMQPFSLTAFVKESFKLARVSVPENIALHRHICSADLIIKGDATQLQQVLMNLLNNARDAVAGTDRPAITIKLREWKADDEFLHAHPDLTGDRFALLTVEDNGSGIHESYMNNIFEPFFTTKEVGQGTGLGLAMVYGSVQSHGGVVEVDSEEGKGTSVHVYLPLLDNEEVSSFPKDAGETYQGHGETILLADDEAHVRQTNKNVLESLGYHVLEASNGEEAFAVFSGNQDVIALLILDVVMPQMGGVETAERIRELSPGIPIIFATGYDKDEVTPQQLPHSMVLSKPFSVNALSLQIRNLLDTPMPFPRKT